MFSFRHVDPDLDILVEKLTVQIGAEFEKHPLNSMSQVGDFIQSLSLVMTCTLMP